MNRLLNFNKVKWVCHHLHIDKSNTVTKDLLNQSQVHMKEKWLLMRDIKQKYTSYGLENRMLKTTSDLVNQGCNKMRTFIDIDSIVGLKPLYEALKVKNICSKNGVDLQMGTQ